MAQKEYNPAPGAAPPRLKRQLGTPDGHDPYRDAADWSPCPLNERLDYMSQGLSPNWGHYTAILRRMEAMPLTAYLQVCPDGIQAFETILGACPDTYGEAAQAIDQLLRSNVQKDRDDGANLLLWLTIPIMLQPGQNSKRSIRI